VIDLTALALRLDRFEDDAAPVWRWLSRAPQEMIFIYDPSTPPGVVEHGTRPSYSRRLRRSGAVLPPVARAVAS
jgi:hypothetical protein